MVCVNVSVSERNKTQVISTCFVSWSKQVLRMYGIWQTSLISPLLCFTALCFHHH